MIEWLQGKKAYVVAAAGVLYGLMLIWSGDTAGGLDYIYKALGLATVRAAIGKAVDDSKKETMEIKQEVQVQGIQQGIKTRESTQEIKQEIANAPVVTLSPQGPQGGV